MKTLYFEIIRPFKVCKNKDIILFFGILFFCLIGESLFNRILEGVFK